jgi:CBS domain-containing protein
MNARTATRQERWRQEDPAEGGNPMGTNDFSERGRHAVNIDALINELADPGAVPDEQAIRDFTEACRRVDEDPQEKQRYRDLADLIEAEDALYDQGVAALGRGDHDTALPLLRFAAQKGVGDAAWLLAVTLDKRGETAEAITWYERAARDGDSRADAVLGARHEPCAVLVRSDLLAVGAIASGALAGGAGDPSPAGEASRPGFQPSAPLFVSHARRDTDQDFSWLPSATWSNLTVMHLAGHGQSLPEAGTFLLWLYTDVPVAAVNRQRETRWLNNKLQRYLAAAEPGCRVLLAPHHGTGNAAFGGKDRTLAGYVTTCLACEHKQRADFAMRFKTFVAGKADHWCGPVLADLAAYTTSHRGVVPWPDRRTVGGTVTGHVMIPYAAIPVLAPDITVDAALGEMLRSGESALPVGEGSAVAGIVTLADLARSVRDSRGVPSIQRIEMLMRPSVEVAMHTPLPEMRAAMARDDAGLVVVRGPGGAVAGYITASSLLAGSVPGRDGSNGDQSRMEVPLLGPGGGTARICVSS